jgi:putative transcriptional regulator
MIMAHSERPANRVRESCSLHGWTQADLAERPGISHTAVTASAGAQLVPSVAAALTLAQALDTSVVELFGQQTGSATVGADG